MRPGLCADEIVRLIACELVASGGRATAVALACCRKSFEDPVLRVLWGAQERLLPLLKTLPGDVWKMGGCTVSSPTPLIFRSFNYLTRKSFNRLPTTPEWVRFRKYARKMRTLGERGDLYILSPKVFSVLQLCAVDEPLFPQLETLKLWRVTGEFVPFIPLFLSPGTTAIDIAFERSRLPKVVVASMITTFPTLCPNLQEITLRFLPRNPVIADAVSGMLLASNQGTLRRFCVYSPLTEAREVVFKLTNLRELSVVIERDISLPPIVLPDLTDISITYDHDHDWLQGFREATIGKLASVTFRPESRPTCDLLEAFESVTLTTTIPATLSTFRFYTLHPWRPNCRALLPFTQLKELVIDFSCDDSCSSTIDDDIITDIARAMPKLEILRLGQAPCRTPAGVTVKGLAALAHYCLNLSTLRIHFQAASFEPRAFSGVTFGGGPTIPREDCALRELDVGEIPLPEGSTLMVAIILLRIFPRIDFIRHFDNDWRKVMDAIEFSRQLDRSSKMSCPYSHHLEVKLMTPLSGAMLENID